MILNIFISMFIVLLIIRTTKTINSDVSNDINAISTFALILLLVYRLTEVN